MALTFCDRIRELPRAAYHLLMMLVSMGIIAAFGSYVAKAINDDGFTFQTMYAMFMGAYIGPHVSMEAYNHGKSLLEQVWLKADSVGY